MKNNDQSNIPGAGASDVPQATPAGFGPGTGSKLPTKHYAKAMTPPKGTPKPGPSRAVQSKDHFN